MILLSYRITRDQRYFTCKPNHGCFMKATNKSITKIPGLGGPKRVPEEVSKVGAVEGTGRIVLVMMLLLLL